MEILVHIYTDCGLSAGGNLKSPEAQTDLVSSRGSRPPPPPHFTSARDELRQDFLRLTVHH